MLSSQELDIQYTVGLATKVPVDYVMVGLKWKDDGLNGYLDEVNHLLSLEKPPQVLTTSYGYPESSMPFNLTEYVSLHPRSMVWLTSVAANCARLTHSLGREVYPCSSPLVTPEQAARLPTGLLRPCSRPTAPSTYYRPPGR